MSDSDSDAKPIPKSKLKQEDSSESQEDSDSEFDEKKSKKRPRTPKKKPPPKAAQNGAKRGRGKQIKDDTSDDNDDQPSKKTKAESDDDDDDLPLDQLKKPKATPTKSTKPKKESSSESDDDIPLDQLAKTPKKSASTKKKSAGDTPEKSKKEKPEEAPVYAWWEEDKKLPEGHKWKTLVHNGILFPPAYEPHGVKMKYDGVEVTLTPEQEEIATWYASMLETEFVKKPVFNKNFFNDFKEALNPKGAPKHPIKTLEKCDFTPIFNFVKRRQEERKSRSKEEKQKEKEEKEKLRERYGVAIVDGVKEKVANYMMEPPGLFRGRGEHPKMGCVKRRVTPEEVTLNLSKGAPVPACPIAGHKWGHIDHRPTVTWLAFWKDTVMNDFKYVFLAPSSRFRGEKDLAKYEKARELHAHIDVIRSDYTNAMGSKDTAAAQLATAMYLIDRLALRVGNEKDTDEEADTVGCCSLRIEHVKPLGDDKIELDFLGKDSIRYLNTVKVEHAVYENVLSFMEGKKPSDDLFDTLNPSKLNKHLGSLMKGLSAKVFRTYNASVTLERCLLDEKEATDNAAVVAEKLVIYNRANREVAILCNHQRAAPKNFQQQLERMDEKIGKVEVDVQNAKTELQQLKTIVKTGKAGNVTTVTRKKEANDSDDEKKPDKKKKKTKQDDEDDEKHANKKKKKTVKSDDEDDEDEEIKSPNKKKKIEVDDDDDDSEEEADESEEEEEKKPKQTKKKAKDDDEKKKRKKPDAEEEEVKEVLIEHTEKVTPEAAEKRLETVEKRVERLVTRLTTLRSQRTTKEDQKTVALGTSKINYCDPRITVAWCKRHDVPVNKVFNKSLLEKFPWAFRNESVTAAWRFVDLDN
eukprot:c9013_g1_i1.p1 GENE.c9013_g1_i1~~c9013_g1_i1.p1  ORF type:complete len:861 (+),score=243.89 c9013_g1_i1:51-2633(+)